MTAPRRLLRWLRVLRGRPRFAVLVYHDVGEAGGSWSVAPSAFEEHLQRLTDLGCSFVSMGQIADSLEGRAGLPDRAVCLHFDDARVGVYERGLPLLARRRLPSALFVVAGWPGGEEPIPEGEDYSAVMSWPQLAEAVGEGLAEIGSHAYRHVNLKRLPPPELEREVRLSRSMIEERIGRPVIHFASPYNRENRAVRRAVVRAGYRTFSAGGNRVNGPWAAAPFRIRRYLVTAGWGGEHLTRVAARLCP